MSSSGQNQSCELTRVAPDVGITWCSDKRIYWSAKLTKHSLLSSVITPSVSLNHFFLLCVYLYNLPFSTSTLSYLSLSSIKPSLLSQTISYLSSIVPTFLTITNRPLLLFTSFSMSPLLTVPPQPKLPSFSSKQLYSTSLPLCLTSFLLLDASYQGYISGSYNPCVRVLHRRPGRSRLVVCTLSL